MAKGFILRGQGLGYDTSKIFLHWPSKAAFEEVMQKELQLHGFEIKKADEANDPITVEARERWVRIEEIEFVTDECAPGDEAPGELLHFTHAKLNDEALAMLLDDARPSGAVESAAPLMQITGTGRVTNPGEPGYEPDESRFRETMTITADDVAQLRLTK